MITDLDNSIKKLLTTELSIKNGEIDIQFAQPTREWSARLNKPTINFFLFDIRENVTLRQHQWEQLARNSDGTPTTTQLKRTPFRLDCHYLLTSWVPQGRADDEHRLLSLLLLTLFRHPTLPPEFFQGQMVQQPFAVPCRVASHDILTNPTEIWTVLDNELRPCISLLVTIALDPWSSHDEELVRYFTLNLGVTMDGRSHNLNTTANKP